MEEAQGDPQLLDRTSERSHRTPPEVSVGGVGGAETRAEADSRVRP